MTEAPTPTKNHPQPPLKQYEKTFCNRCSDQQYCNTNTQRRHLCILTLLAKKLGILCEIADEYLTRHILETG